MIFTYRWLDEYVNLKGIDADAVVAKLNAIGHEVAVVEAITPPSGVVIGHVISCERHPDADKLSVTTVDIGQGEPVQIVCGAKNVRQGLYVAVATLGTTLPNGLTMKPVKLRGVESNGMICSAEEIGLGKMNEGIMEFDESLGQLKIGMALTEIEALNDTLIEVELTANRGDCLSLYGIARDISAAFNSEMRALPTTLNDDNAKGIGRVLQVDCKEDVDASVIYKVVESEAIASNFLIDMRLGLIGKYKASSMERLLEYTTHSTGVLVHAYDYHSFDRNEGEKAQITLKKEDEINTVCSEQGSMAQLGMSQKEEAKYSGEQNLIVLEASYVDPDEISRIVQMNKLKTGDEYYRASRGSEPNLEMGMNHLSHMLDRCNEATFYSEKISSIQEQEMRSIHCSVDSINALIGQEIGKNEMVQLLKRLHLDVQVTAEQSNLIVRIPQFRHDLINANDITEEIVRMVGIDNIAPKPLQMDEYNNENDTLRRYKYERELSKRAIASGFYQTLKFVFTDAERQEQYGFDNMLPSMRLLNPITSELNTLRSTLLINLLDAVGENFRKSRKSVALFEIGQRVDKQRDESKAMAFVMSGAKESEDILNHGKPAAVDIKSFVQKLKAVFPNALFAPCSHQNGLIHPGQAADVIIDGKVVGFVSKLHPKAATDFDLGESFIAEINLDAIALKSVQAVPTSKYQRIERDLSVVIHKEVIFSEIKATVDALAIPELIALYPADFYEDESLGDKVSLTLRFTLQSMEETLSEERSTEVMNQLLSTLQEHFKAELR